MNRITISLCSTLILMSASAQAEDNAHDDQWDMPPRMAQTGMTLADAIPVEVWHLWSEILPSSDTEKGVQKKLEVSLASQSNK